MDYNNATTLISSLGVPTALLLLGVPMVYKLFNSLNATIDKIAVNQNSLAMAFTELKATTQNILDTQEKITETQVKSVETLTRLVMYIDTKKEG